MGHAKSRGQHLTEAEGRGVGQDTHSSSPVARGSSFCPDLCGGCGALQLAPVSVLWLLCPWQCTGIWGAMTGPSRTKSPYLPRTLQRKKKGAGGGGIPSHAPWQLKAGVPQRAGRTPPPMPGQSCTPAGCTLLPPASLQSQAGHGRAGQGALGPHCSFSVHADRPPSSLPAHGPW